MVRFDGIHGSPDCSKVDPHTLIVTAFLDNPRPYSHFFLIPFLLDRSDKRRKDDIPDNIVLPAFTVPTTVSETRSVVMSDCLDGSKMSQCRLLHDPYSNSELPFFVFPDLFCRASGVYRLRFCLFRLPYDILDVLPVSHFFKITFRNRKRSKQGAW